LKADRILLHSIRDITLDEYIAAGRLEYLPMKFMSYEVCCEFVKNSRTYLTSVPNEYRNEEICKIAVKHGKSLLGVPVEFRTYDICEIAIRNDPWAILHVPKKKVLDSKLCMLAVHMNYYTFDHVPKRFRTKEMWDIVIKTGDYDIRDVPKKYLAKELKMLL
jgi:hypothetical protein